jgi:ketopantoate hydroxymethyltransferase
MLGITQEFSPRFLRRYHNLSEEIQGSVSSLYQRYQVAGVSEREGSNIEE